MTVTGEICLCVLPVVKGSVSSYFMQEVSGGLAKPIPWLDSCHGSCTHRTLLRQGCELVCRCPPQTPALGRPNVQRGKGHAVMVSSPSILSWWKETEDVNCICESAVN